MSETQLNIQHAQLNLFRFPISNFDKSLRAWDAADEYIINDLYNSLAGNIDATSKVLIVNDGFGALSCALRTLFPNLSIYTFTDSYMSLLATQKNIIRNNLAAVPVKSVLDLSRVKEHDLSFDFVLLKIPRTHNYLEFLLQHINGVASPNAQIIAGAMTKMISSQVMSLFDKHLHNPTSSLAKKKARLIYATKRASSEQAVVSINKISESDLPFSLYNFPNVFCYDQIDIGARLMIEALSKIDFSGQHVIDLGCGNGILGKLLATQNKDLKVSFVDESFMAIASAKQTWQQTSQIHNEPTEKIDSNTNTANFFVGHCLSELSDLTNDVPSGLGESTVGIEQADTVVCNPPFHQQSTITDEIAWQMFKDAHAALKPQGKLIIVGNRHLKHTAKLSKLFGGCKVLESNRKFVVLMAKKT